MRLEQATTKRQLKQASSRTNPLYITEAVKCGPVDIDLEGWKTKPIDQLTNGEKVLRWAEYALVFPEGKMIGKPLVLAPFQQAFVLAAFDDQPVHRKKAILSVARRAGKTLVMAVILLAYIIGPMARRNSMVRSAAMSREQAGLVFRLMRLILEMSPRCAGHYRFVPSQKMVVGLRSGVEYQALSRDTKTGHGQGIYALVVDECRQIDAPFDDYLGMLFSSLGTYDDSKIFMISTQAASDAAFFSLEIDTAIREQPDDTVCHLYAAKDDDILSEDNWYQANPSLHCGYRSLADLRGLAEDASRIPAKQNDFINLNLNRRVSLTGAWLAPSIWKENGGPIDMQVFRDNPVSLGLDLSTVNDLSAAVIAAPDADGNVHLKVYAFTPLDGAKQRENENKIPLTTWIKDGTLYAPPGRTLDYEQIAAYLKQEFDREGIRVGTIHFDRWRSTVFFQACERVGFATDAVRNEVGQGYQSMTPRLEAFETALLQCRIRHGGQPVLNMGAAAAMVQRDPSGNRKLTKQFEKGPKIDALVAAVMAGYPLLAPTEPVVSIDAWIG